MTKVAVVGLGALGSATAYQLAKAGHTVVGLEQFELGHARGASHDSSRIIRHSYHTADYVRLTHQAYAAWAALEEDSGEHLVTITGGVDLFPPGAAIQPDTYRTSLDAAGVAYEWIDGAEVRSRWPAFAVDDAVNAIYQARTGIVPAAAGTHAMQWLATRLGGDLRQRITVRALRPTAAGGVELVTSAGTIGADAVVVTADAWADRLLGPLGSPVGLTVTREQVTYFHSLRSAELRPGHFPVWIWMDDPSFYGFPVYGAAHTVKAAEDCGGAEVDPDTRGFDPDPAAQARLGTFMAGLLGHELTVDHSSTCLYALTPDRDFVLDRHPEHPQIVVGLGAAHGFKFAPWFGQRLAALATGLPAPPDLAPFSLIRPGLGTATPADRSRWLV